MSGVVWRIVEPTYHSSVEWLIADVTDVSTLHQLSVFHAWVIVRLTLRYTTPDMHCRDRPHECDGGINYDIMCYRFRCDWRWCWSVDAVMFSFHSVVSRAVRCSVPRSSVLTSTERACATVSDTSSARYNVCLTCTPVTGKVDDWSQTDLADLSLLSSLVFFYMP